MTARDRGLTVDQARKIASDPKTAPSVLSRLANGYPEVWQLLLTNPGTPEDLRAWLKNALTPKPTVTVAPARASTRPNSTDETLIVERPQRGAKSATRADSSQNVAAREQTVPTPPVVVARAPRTRRRSQPARGAAVTLAVSLLCVGALGAVSAGAITSMPEPGLIETRELATEPSTTGSWTYDLVQGQENADCIEWTFQSLAQDAVVVLSQFTSANDGCDEIEDEPETFLALVNTATGVESWRVNVGDELSWTTDWTKDLTEFAGLNEIVVKFTDTSDEEQEDPPQTLVPFNRLDGSVTDPVMARSESDPTITAPHIEVGRIPWSDRNVVVGFPASDDDRRLSLRRAKNLTEDKWSLTTLLEPIHGNPVVGNSIILGSEYDDEAIAVDIDSGEDRVWNGPAGGKMLSVGGSFVHVSGDGTKERVSNSEAEAGTAETSDCDAECVTLTGISTTGDVLWEKKVPGYAVARDPSITMNADRSEYTQLFVVNPDRNGATRINPENGELAWGVDQEWGEFSIAKFSTRSAFFTYETTPDSDHTDRLQIRDIFSGEVLGQYEIPNDQSRIDGVSARLVYLVDEPDREAAVEEIEAGESVGGSSEEEDEDLANEKRTCITAISTVTFDVEWEFTCNGYQHAFLAAGNWVLFDKTPEQQAIRGLLSPN